MQGSRDMEQPHTSDGFMYYVARTLRFELECVQRGQPCPDKKWAALMLGHVQPLVLIAVLPVHQLRQSGGSGHPQSWGQLRLAHPLAG